MEPVTIVPSAVLAPLVLRDHVYSVIDNRSEVDREVEALRRQNHVRMLRLTATSEVALVLTSDYCSLVRSKITPSTRDALLCFEAALVNVTSVSVTADALRRALVGCAEAGQQRSGGDAANDPDRILQIATRLGFLRARRDTETTEREVNRRPRQSERHEQHPLIAIAVLGCARTLLVPGFLVFGAASGFLQHEPREWTCGAGGIAPENQAEGGAPAGIVKEITAADGNALDASPHPLFLCVLNDCTGLCALIQQDLGLALHVLDLEISGEILRLNTASGPLIRLREQQRRRHGRSQDM